MKFNLSIIFSILVVSAVVAHPTLERRQRQVCPLISRTAEVSIVTVRDPQRQTRWDVLTSAFNGIGAGEIIWFQNAQPNFNEGMRPSGSSVPNPLNTNLIILNSPSFLSIGIETGTQNLIQTKDFAANWLVACDACPEGDSDGKLIGQNCKMEVADATGLNTLGLCVTFTQDLDHVKALLCSADPNDPNQLFDFFIRDKIGPGGA